MACVATTSSTYGRKCGSEVRIVDRIVDITAWERALERLPVATADQIADRDLQRRSEVKFVTGADTAFRLVAALSSRYAVMMAGARRVAAYRSLYFDTPTLDLFHAHRRGRRVRYKVRIRHYADRRISTLEVKARLSDLVSHKVRRSRSYGDNWLATHDRDFIATICPFEALREQAWVDYRRVSLLNVTGEERVTIDLDMCLRRGTKERRLPGLAVIEVKQPVLDRRTAVVTALRELRVREGWASKYCTAVMLTTAGVRAHRLRQGMRALETAGGGVSEWASVTC